MENTNDFLDMDNRSLELKLNNAARASLAETIKWANFISIVGFVMTTLMFFFGLVFMLTMSSIPQNMSEIGYMGPFMGLLYIFISAIYIYPIYKLYHFAKFGKAALSSSDNNLLAQSFENQKSVYKFVGILTLILLVFYALMLIFSIGGAMFGMMR